MSTVLKIVTSISENNWQLEFSLNDNPEIPRDIFMFENLGEGLGQYQGVCTLNDYKKLQTYSPGVSIPVFGNKFLKYSIGKLSFPININPQLIRDKITADVKTFKAAFLASQNVTTNINI